MPFRSRIAACAGGRVSANIYAGGLAEGSEGRGKVVLELDVGFFFEAGILTGSRIPFDLLAGDEGAGGLEGIFEELAEGKGAVVGVVLGGGEDPVFSSWAGGGGGHFRGGGPWLVGDG